MTPEREDKLRRILRLASLLSTDEQSEYIAAMTKGDDELRRAVEGALTTEVSLAQTLLERPRSPDTPDHP